MASEDADRSSSRLSSFSVYDDPPVTDPILIKRQLDLEVQLKSCLEQLIKEYLDTDSLEKVEELTTHQLCCCGRISALRLQLLRLKRSPSIAEDQCDVDDPLELPQVLLDLLADDTVTMDSTAEEIITSSDNGVETKATDHPVTNSLRTLIDTSSNSLIATGDLVSDDAIDAELTEMVETVVNKTIKNAVTYLVEQSTATSLDIHAPSAVEVWNNRDGEKDITKVKATVENASGDNDCTTEENTTTPLDVLPPLSVDVHNEDKEKDVIDVKTTIKSELTNDEQNTETQENKMAAATTDNGQVVNISSEEDMAQDNPPNLKEVHNKNEEVPIEPVRSTESHTSIGTEPHTNTDTCTSSEPHVGTESLTSTQNTAEAAKPVTEEPVTMENTSIQLEHIKHDKPVKDDEATKDIETLKEDPISSELTSDPIKELPTKCDSDGDSFPNRENLSPAKVSHSSSVSGMGSSIPSDGEKLDSTQISSPAEVVQKSRIKTADKTKRALVHAQSNPILDEPVDKTKPVNSPKAQTLDFRTSSSVDPKKKIKTLAKKSSAFTTSASVTPLGAFSTFEWDPTCLLEELYVDCKPISPPDVHPSRLVVEMEKLPRNQVKKTVTKGWKKRYFCITSGNLYYYEDKKMAKALGVVKLNGAKIVCGEDSVIKVTDKLNQTIAIRGKPEDTYRMHRALHLESVHPTLVSVISPYPGGDHPVVIVDIGSCSVRAGFAQGEAYPQLFFPAVCSVVKDTDEIRSCGLNALTPSARQNCEIVFPTRQKLRMDQEASVPVGYIQFFLQYIFKELRVEPTSAKVIMTLPQNYTEKDKELLMEVLLDNLSCEAACLLEQNILSLYSYGATSGIVVDIGDRTDIVPIVDGFKIESGITKLKIGGAAVTESLRRLSTEYGLRYFSDVEFYITRLIKEKIGFVSQDFGNDLEHCTADAASYKRALDVTQYHLPDRKSVIAMDSPLFRSLEGFFQPSMWGKDIPSIAESVLKAIQACSIDRRREMSRSIFLSGGGTLATGFQERLEQELIMIAPSSYTVQVQASVSRHHAAFLGAAVLASLDSFQDTWITKEDFIRLKI